MTLVDRLQAIVNDATELKQKEKERAKAKLVEEQASQLSTEASRIGGARERALVLREHNRPVDELPPIEASASALADFEGALALGEDAKTKRAFAKLAKLLKKLAETTEEIVESALDESLSEIKRRWRSKATLESRLEIEEQVAATRQALAELEQIHTVSQWKKASPGELHALLLRRGRLLESLDKILSQDVSDAVLSFLKAARTTGATYEMLTDEVSDYLKDKGRLDKIRITFR